MHSIQSTPFASFPDELILNIYHFLDYRSQASLRAASTNYYRLCVDFPEGEIIKSVYCQIKKIHRVTDCDYGDPSLLKDNVLTLTSNIQENNLVGELDPSGSFHKKNRFKLKVVCRPFGFWGNLLRSGDSKIVEIAITYLSKRLSKAQAKSVIEAVAIANRRLKKKPYWSCLETIDSTGL